MRGSNCVPAFRRSSSSASSSLRGSAYGREFVIASKGVAHEDDPADQRDLLLAEAVGPSGALRLADQRMYAQKYSRRNSVGRQTTEVLLRALSEARREDRP